jgi:exodeoxyribonuclease VII large subunit
LSDFAADVRAPTPSAAAEIGAPDRADMETDLLETRDLMYRVLADQISQHRRDLRAQQDRLKRTSPIARINNAKQQVDDQFFRMRTAATHMIHLRKAAVEGLTQTLRAVGPSAILARGFALVHRTEDGVLVRSVDQVERGDELNIRVRDGEIRAKVNAPSDDV